MATDVTPTHSMAAASEATAPRKKGIRTMLLYLLLGFVVLLAALALFVASRPNHFEVSRSMLIDAPPSAIFPHVHNLRAWKAWSPYEKVDPNMTQSYEGPDSGQGAVMRWSGNSQAGAGSTEIMESVPDERIDILLTMTKPMNCQNDVRFTFQPQGEATLVTWHMQGKVGFVPKIFHLIINMDQMVGGQFEEGLTALKSLAEQEATATVDL